jgi:hypothetical protein
MPETGACLASLRFIRYPLRFKVVAGFALALLAAAGLEALRRRLPGRAGPVVAAAIGIVLVVDPARNLLRFETYGVAALGWNAWVYERVARIAREEGPGPLLELPLKGRCEAAKEGC